MIRHIFNTILAYSKAITYIKEYSSNIRLNKDHYIVYIHNGRKRYFNWRLITLFNWYETIFNSSSRMTGKLPKRYFYSKLHL